MNKTYSKVLGVTALTAIASMLAGCVDDSYNFDNYDGTVQLEVKDLVLPLEIDPVTFESVLNIGSQDGIGYDEHDNYVLLKSGQFASTEEIRINPIVAQPSPNVFESEDITIGGVAGMQATLNTESVAKLEFDVNYDQVDEYIRGIDSAEVECEITLSVTTDFNCTYNVLRFRVPEGMKGEVISSYTPKVNNGVIEFSNITSRNFSFIYKVSEIVLKPENFEVFPSGPGIFKLHDSIALTYVDVKANQTGTGNIRASFSVSDIDVKSVSGKLRYKLDDIENVTSLTDLPDVLTEGSNTRIGLKNPQLYLKVNNPAAKYGDVRASAGLKIEQVRTSGWLTESTHQTGIAHDLIIKGVEGDQLFLLADQEPTEIYDAFTGVQWNPDYRIPNLGNIIYGDGLPQELKFTFTNPQLLESTVTKLPIGGEGIGKIAGDYSFYAPLDFTNGSQIVYTQRQTGWGVDVDEDLQISTMEISAHVVSDIPVAVKFEAWPLEMDEHDNVVTNKAVYVDGAEIGAKETKDVKIKLVGDIKHLEGMLYKVTLAAGANSSILNPGQKLTFSNLKVKVSGKYLMRDKGDDDYDYEYDYED